MTPTELRDQLTRLGLTQGQAGRICGVDPRAVRRWIAGDRAVPPSAQRLLWLCERDPDLIPLLLDFRDDGETPP